MMKGGIKENIRQVKRKWRATSKCSFWECVLNDDIMFFKLIELLGLRMMGQVLLEVANAVADWVGFEGEVASGPCNRPWLRKEVDR